MTEPIVITKEELDFSTVYGTLFSLGTTVEYLACLRGLMLERNAKYVANKAKQAEDACQFVYDTLEREMMKRLTLEEKAIAMAAIDHHKLLIYDFFLMDNNDQHRVKQLMDKIKKQRA